MTRPTREAMLTGPVLPVLLRLGLPTIVVIMAQILVQVIETYWASRLGADALAGVALVTPLVLLMTTMSNGGIGGGVSSAVARALGQGRREEADAIAWHALLIGVGFGLGFTIVALTAGAAIYGALGGSGAVLSAALTYSGWLFAGAVPFWAFNLLTAALRGAGEVRLPARISLVGAGVTVLLSPLLIFGPGPLPAFGLAGAALAVNLYYLGALAVVVRHMGRGEVLTLRPTRLSRARFATILRVGLISAAGTLVASLTIVLVTGAVGRLGGAALAGYGVASRIVSLLVPLMFALGTAVITMVGTATGAGDPARASRVTWVAVAMGAAATGVIGLVAAIFAEGWMRLFSTDPAVVAAGVDYLHAAAPFYAALGVSLSLYFACQGFGRMAWPFAGGVLRLLLSAALAWMLVGIGWGMAGVGAAVAIGTISSALVTAVGLLGGRPRGDLGRPAGAVT